MGLIQTLIVEDEFLVRLGVKTLINWEQQGFCIVGEAANGEEALALYRQHHPQLIITDIKMPRMDGLSLMRAIRAEDKNVRFIVLTAYNEFSYAKQSIDLGVESYLVKGSMLNDELAEVLARLRAQLANNGESYTGGSRSNDFQHLHRAIQAGDKLDTLEALPSSPSGWWQVCCIRISGHRRKPLLQSLRDICANTLIQQQINGLPLPDDEAFLALLPVEAEPRSVLISMSISVGRYFDEQAYCGLSQQAEGHSALNTCVSQAKSACDRNILTLASPPIYLYEKSKPADHAKLDADISALESALLAADAERCTAQLSRMQDEMAAMGSIKQLRRLIYRIALILTRHDEQLDENEMVRQLMNGDRLEDIFAAGKERFTALCRHMRELVPQNKRYIEEAKLYVRNNLDKNIKLRDVSSQIHLSPNYLGKLFYTETGQYLTDYIIQEKMAMACRLLCQNAVAIADVAQRVGIPDQHYFSKLFKKKMGVSPKDYVLQQKDDKQPTHT